MSSVTTWTGRMTAHIVWDWAPDCSRLVVLRRQRSCLQNSYVSDWQRVFKCRQNAVVWYGRRQRADSRRPGDPTALPDKDQWTRVAILNITCYQQLSNLSDTGIGNKPTRPGNPGVAGQGPVDGSRNLEDNVLPHRKPEQLAKHKRDMITLPYTSHEPVDSILNWLQAACQYVSDADVCPQMGCTSASFWKIHKSTQMQF